MISRRVAPSLNYNNSFLYNQQNPQSLNQKSLSYIRDVLSLVMNPALKDRAPELFAPDVKVALYTLCTVPIYSIPYIPYILYIPYIPYTQGSSTEVLGKYIERWLVQ